MSSRKYCISKKNLRKVETVEAAVEVYYVSVKKGLIDCQLYAPKISYWYFHKPLHI